MEINAAFVLRFVVWLLVSGVWAILTGLGIWKWLAVGRWRTTRGEILASTIAARPGEDNTTIYSPSVRYRYRVAEKDYESSDIVLFPVSSSDQRYVQKTVARYPKNAPVKVYYDPRNPASALLERHVQLMPAFFLFMYFGVVVVLTLILLGYLG